MSISKEPSKSCISGLSVEMEDERIYLLKEEPGSREKGIMPEYLVFEKSESEFVLSEKRPAVVVEETDMVHFQNDGAGAEQYSVNDGAAGIICQERGVFLALNEGINEAFKRSGLNPFQLHTVFFKINDFRKYCEERFDENKHDMVMDITDQFILISDMLSRLTLYRIDDLRTVPISEIDIMDRETGEYCNVKNAVVGDENGSFLYCQLNGMTIAKVNSSDGIIEWKRQWIPGINIIGCDFRGVTFTSEVEKLLVMLGVIQDVNVD